ncbi:MAG TPA: hypothetical protein VGM56_10225 [Byssovorax sp.]|jgi:hypothetical protein
MAIFDKAKELKEQATQKAAAIAEQANQRAAEVREKAAEVKESATQKAAEVAAGAQRAADETRAHAEQAAAAARDGVASAAASAKATVANAANDAKDASIARVKETIADFNEALPIIRSAGYRVTGVDIALGLPPKVSASVTVSDEVTPEHVEAVLEAHKDKKLTCLIVRSLFQAWKLHSAISIVGMKPRGMSIELGLIPNVGIKFVAIDPPPPAGAPALPPAPAAADETG